MKTNVLLSLFFFLLLSENGFAQGLEWEIFNGGFAFGFQSDDRNRPLELGGALTMGTEVRYNHKEKPLSTGLQFTFTGWNREYPYLHQNAFIFLLVTDYNFKNVHPKILPFAGIGAGYNMMREWGDEIVERDYKSHLALSPRVGIEFFKRIRLTAEYQYIGNKNSFFNIKIGFVVGS